MSRARLVWWISSSAALLWGGIAAARHAWTCDDAFISFRYARNLVEGHGLVFNPGERVEGFTNLLWTLWSAFGLAPGLDAERWAQAWGIVFYLGSIALLLAFHQRIDVHRSFRFTLPVAALGAAACQDWNIWASGGLETSAFTFLALAGYMLLTRKAQPRKGPLGAGLVVALCALTRPDGLIFATLGFLYLSWTGRPKTPALVAYSAGFAVLWLPVTVGRVVYYGDFLPNTYYAKSAQQAWFAQGLHYLGLYFHKNWPLLLTAVLLLAFFGKTFLLGRRRSKGEKRSPGPFLDQRTVQLTPDSNGPAGSAAPRFQRDAALATLFALGYSAYVVRVGGDFMHARLLIPATPFYLILLELALYWLWRDKPIRQLALTALTVTGLALTPFPMQGAESIHGVTNERAFYSHEFTDRIDRRARVLQRYFEGLPVRVAFLGTEARLVYYARIPYAVESETGLTDRELARRPLPHRGRVGHEKIAPMEFLVRQRKVHFAFSGMAPRVLRLDDSLPAAEIRLDGEQGRILRWDPELMAALKARGAAFVDFVPWLDSEIARLNDRTNAEVAADYEKLELFYFDHVVDPDRQEPFRRRLGR